MKHIGIQQIASLVPDSCRLDESFVFLGNDGIARLAGYNVVGCRLLLMVSDGSLDMKINGKHAVVRENDFVDILEGTRVCFAMPDPEIRVICMVTTRKFIMDSLQGVIPDIQNYILKILTEPVMHLRQNEADVLLAQAGLVESAVLDVRHRYREELVKVYFKAFSLNLSNIVLDKYDKRSSRALHGIKKRDNLISGFMELVWESFLENREVSFYARELCVTPKHLSRVIKEATGKSPHEIIAGEVLALSVQLLQNDDMLVQQVADILHFSDQAAFSKFFKKYTGLSPADFRKAGKRL